MHRNEYSMGQPQSDTRIGITTISQEQRPPSQKEILTTFTCSQPHPWSYKTHALQFLVPPDQPDCEYLTHPPPQSAHWQLYQARAGTSTFAIKMHALDGQKGRPKLQTLNDIAAAGKLSAQPLWVVPDNQPVVYTFHHHSITLVAPDIPGSSQQRQPLDMSQQQAADFVARSEPLTSLLHHCHQLFISAAAAASQPAALPAADQHPLMHLEQTANQRQPDLPEQVHLQQQYQPASGEAMLAALPPA